MYKRQGVARLSLRCDVPIIPVGIVGTRVVQPPGSRFMRPFHPVTVRFGPPVAYLRRGEMMTTGSCVDGLGSGADADSRERDQAELRGLTDSLMSEIAKLSDQEYVDQYATRVRAG